MKKTHLLSFLIMAVISVVSASTGMAQETTVKIKYIPKKTGTETRQRTPMNLPIEVIYDSDSYSIMISSTLADEAEVFIYDAAGELEDYSTSLNTVMSVGDSEYHTLYIEAENWTAVGTF